MRKSLVGRITFAALATLIIPGADCAFKAALWGGWIAKAEYLYMNLGSLSTTVDISVPSFPASVTTNGTVRDDIVRIGGNYHFSAGAEVIATDPERAAVDLL